LSSVEDVKALSSQELPSVAIGTVPGDSPIDETMGKVLGALFEAEGKVEVVPGVQRKRVLLEMAYKPSVTPLMELATGHAWKTVPGLEPLVGQGVHQVSALSSKCVVTNFAN